MYFKKEISVIYILVYMYNTCSFTGVQGLVEFQSIAAMKGWRIMNVQHFRVTPDPSLVDAKDNLAIIKEIGNSKLFIISCPRLIGNVRAQY